MKRSAIAILLALILSLGCFAGCAQAEASAVQLAAGGTLILSVNPEIAIEYDDTGKVTGVSARNDDALAIIASCTGLIGQEASEAVNQLVTAIGEAGYFLEEVEGRTRQITLEIEPGSSLPTATFLDDLVAGIRTCVSTNDWTTPLVVEGMTDFGFSNYDDTDYGPNNDGITDFNEPATDYGVTDYNDPVTDYGITDYAAPTAGATEPTAGYGVTDYDDTDYGPNSDGVTDFGVTDYDDTDYGPNSDGVTDFGVTDYDDTDYGPNNDGVTDFSEPVTDYGITDYNDPATDYGATDYQKPAATSAPKKDGDSGYTDYDKGVTDYDRDGTDYD